MRSRIRTAAGLVAVIAATLLVPNVRADVEIERFGESLADMLQSGDAEAFTEVIDRDTLVDRALAGLEGDDRVVEEVGKGLHGALARVGAVLTQNLGPTAKLSYVRVREVDGVTRVLVRLDLGERGLNYLDFFVHRRADGTWAVYDWIDYVQGQAYTESLTMVLAMMVRQSPSLMSRVFGVPAIDREVTERIAEMGQLGQKLDWVGWLRVYRELPERLRHNRVLLATRVAVANATGDDDEYLRAMTDLNEHHGDDPKLSLTLVDYHLLTGNTDRAYRAVDRLDRYTGGDAALTNLRAGIALYAGDNEASIDHARTAIAEDADLEDPYWHLMLAGSRAGDYDAAMEGVRALETRFGYAFSEDELMESEDFSGLIASDAWRSSGSR